MLDVYIDILSLISTLMSESLFRVIALSLLASPFQELDIEPDAMHKPLLIKKGTD